jgi:hypothetical protein
LRAVAAILPRTLRAVAVVASGSVVVFGAGAHFAHCGFFFGFDRAGRFVAAFLIGVFVEAASRTGRLVVLTSHVSVFAAEGRVAELDAAGDVAIGGDDDEFDDGVEPIRVGVGLNFDFGIVGHKVVTDVGGELNQPFLFGGGEGNFGTEEAVGDPGTGDSAGGFGELELDEILELLPPVGTRFGSYRFQLLKNRAAVVMDGA